METGQLVVLQRINVCYIMYAKQLVIVAVMPATGHILVGCIAGIKEVVAYMVALSE